MGDIKQKDVIDRTLKLEKILQRGPVSKKFAKHI